MKVTPFNNDFVIDQFILSLTLFEKGYVQLSRPPEIETVNLLVESTNDVIFPQYQIIEMIEEYRTIFPDVDVGVYVLSWFLDGSSSSSSSVNPCVIPDPLDDLYGTAYYILEQNIGKTIQVRYIAKS